MKHVRFWLVCLILALMMPWVSYADPTPTPELTLEVEEQGLDLYLGAPAVAAVFGIEDKATGIASTVPFLSYRTDLGPIKSVDPTLSAGVEYITDATYLGLAATVDLSGPPAWLLGKSVGAVFGEDVGSVISNATRVKAGVMGGGKIGGDEEADNWRIDLYIGGSLEFNF